MSYYEEQCTKERKEVYRALLQGVLRIESVIRVPLLRIEDYSDIYTRLRLDHPEIFYFSGFKIRSTKGAENAELIAEYLFEKDKIQAHKKAISARIERVIRPIAEKSEAEKIAFLHSFILQNVRYDKLKKSYSHEVIGPLTQGVGVCEGIAKTVKLLADALNVECLVALSLPQEGKRYGHTWNVIRQNGKWYHLDATFDLSLCACGEARADYYLLCDTQIFRDHEKPAYPIPECRDADRFFYKASKLSFTKHEDLAKRILQAAKKNKPRFIFHWRGGYLTKDALSKLFETIRSAAKEAQKYAKLSLNYPQAVFCVSLSNESFSEEVLTENPNEEE